MRCFPLWGLSSDLTPDIHEESLNLGYKHNKQVNNTAAKHGDKNRRDYGSVSSENHWCPMYVT